MNVQPNNNIGVIKPQGLTVNKNVFRFVYTNILGNSIKVSYFDGRKFHLFHFTGARAFDKFWGVIEPISALYCFLVSLEYVTDDKMGILDRVRRIRIMGDGNERNRAILTTNDDHINAILNSEHSYQTFGVWACFGGLLISRKDFTNTYNRESSARVISEDDKVKITNKG